MTTRSPSDPRPADAVDPALADPFWAALRRAEPATDLVLLPATRASGAPPTLPLDVVGALVEIADAEFAALLVVLEETAADVATLPALWWRQDDPGSHRYLLEAVASGLASDGGGDGDCDGDCSSVGEGPGGAAGVASRLVADWRVNGWRVRGLAGPHPAAAATLGPLEASVTAYPDRVRVSVRTVPLVLADGDLREVQDGRVGRATRIGEVTR